MKRGTPRKRVKLVTRFFIALAPEPLNETEDWPQKPAKICQNLPKIITASPLDPSNEAGDPSKKSVKKMAKLPRTLARHYSSANFNCPASPFGLAACLGPFLLLRLL